ncbi:MAG TPA: zinc ribbon domain-containing protein, partial [Nitrospinota bacterium]|nr:zinc ribbon domain-containing protein [Nitrospinota bacterium]
TIKDLEFDYRTGKLSQADYMELKNRYEAEALQTLKEIDDFKVQEKGAVFCPKCGTKTKAEDNFCFKCGAKLPQG